MPRPSRKKNNKKTKQRGSPRSVVNSADLQEEEEKEMLACELMRISLVDKDEDTFIRYLEELLGNDDCALTPEYLKTIGLGPQRTTVFYSVCSQGQARAAIALLDHGAADVNRASIPGNHTPFWGACKGGHLEVVKLLASLPACDMNIAPSIDSTPPFARACNKGHLPVVNFLLGSESVSKRINLNAKCHNGGSALSTAVEAGHYDVAKCLLADRRILRKNYYDRLGHNIMDSAYYAGKLPIIKLLEETGDFDDPTNPQHALKMGERNGEGNPRDRQETKEYLSTRSYEDKSLLFERNPLADEAEAEPTEAEPITPPLSPWEMFCHSIGPSYDINFEPVKLSTEFNTHNRVRPQLVELELPKEAGSHWCTTCGKDISKGKQFFYCRPCHKHRVCSERCGQHALHHCRIRPPRGYCPCGKDGIFTCTVCKAKHYCGPSCQLEDKKNHKHQCVPAAY